MTESELRNNSDWVEINEGEIANIIHKLDSKDGDGEKTVYVYAKDLANNISLVPRIGKINLKGKWINKENYIEINVKAADKNLNTVTYNNISNENIGLYIGNNKINGAIIEIDENINIPIKEVINGNSMYTTNYKIISSNIIGEGKLSIAVENSGIKDNAGNIISNNKVETEIIIDNTNPELTTEVEGNNIVIEVTDSNLYEYVVVNNKMISLVNGRITYNASKSGTYIILAYDKAGNTVTKTIII